MIVISKITPPPLDNKNSARTKIREIISNNFPADLMSVSTSVIINTDCDIVTMDDVLEEVKNTILKSIGRKDIIVFLQKYESFVKKSISEDKEIAKEDKNSDILYYGFSYIMKVNRDTEPDMDGVEPTDEEMYRSYCSPLLPINSQFIASMINNELPSGISAYIEDILNFRNSVVSESDNYLQDINYDELVNSYFSSAERDMLGFSL